MPTSLVMTRELILFGLGGLTDHNRNIATYILQNARWAIWTYRYNIVQQYNNVCKSPNDVFVLNVNRDIKLANIGVSEEKRLAFCANNVVAEMRGCRMRCLL